MHGTGESQTVCVGDTMQVECVMDDRVRFVLLVGGEQHRTRVSFGKLSSYLTLWRNVGKKTNCKGTTAKRSMKDTTANHNRKKTLSINGQMEDKTKTWKPAVTGIIILT